MARPREFSETEVLHSAIATFGAQGFNALSVDTLLKKVGLNRSSFYKIYGSKHGLFQAALTRVCELAAEGKTDDHSEDFILIALTELAPSHPDIRKLAKKAVTLCFNDCPTLLGHHLLIRAGLTP